LDEMAATVQGLARACPRSPFHPRCRCLLRLY
jgi:hypothetical protein